MFLEEKQIPYQDRCEDCYMRLTHCICPSIPKINNKIPLSLVMHAREVYKTTNTGRIAHLSLNNSQVLVRGDKERPLKTSDYFPAGPHYLFLTFSEKSKTLTPELVNSLRGPLHLVVPDGNWRQANKMGKREVALQQMTWIKLPKTTPSSYQLRREHHIEGLSTLEAIARCYGFLGDTRAQVELEEIFHLMVRRTLETRAPIERNKPRP